MKNNKLIFIRNLFAINVPTIIAILVSQFCGGGFVNASMLIIYVIYCIAMVYPIGVLGVELSDNKIVNLISLSVGAIILSIIVIFSYDTNAIMIFFTNVSCVALSFIKIDLSYSAEFILVRLFQILSVVFPYCMCGVGIKIQSSW